MLMLQMIGMLKNIGDKFMTRYVYISHSALVHHGIKGMKWGKRNGPPYPLDASDHSAAEKKANNGRYSQGVKQNRSKMTDEERAEKIRKIKKGIAIGAGITGAAALTAGGIYLAKHPETAKAALNGIKELGVGAAQRLKSGIKVNKIKNEGFKKNAMAKVTGKWNKTKTNVFNNLKSANKTDKKNNLISKVERKRNKTGSLKDVTSDSAISKMMDNPRLIEANRDKIIARNGGGTKGRDAYEGLIKKARSYEINNNEASRYTQEYKSNKGIKGVAKKVWAPVAATTGVIGTVGGAVGRVNNAINTVGNTMNNRYIRDAYNQFMADPYYDEQPKKKKQGGN